ncbi:hypothetical protein [Leptothoe sp. PORK10 BA2]|uniref:hypothetical protein n=1 Tax=Leptothoe sp. PORK10 BA2 TaxID=3110254 RepID=UPI002B20373E|nr:hypothetical protein [Leptothoe sp. PORK10 BA2]MEA5466396.1 hypothetical protein [Leptothoe sp. PORK10 BA2]
MENVESYSFDQFLGLAIHLFITTQSQHTREQLVQQFPKFGSAAVLPLVKVICRMPPQSELPLLAQASLEDMAPPSLIIGLNQVLDCETDDDLREIAIQKLMNLMQKYDQSVLLLLPKLVSQQTWRLLKLHLLAESPYPKFNQACLNNKLPVKVKCSL